MVSPAGLSGDELDREWRLACLSRAVGEKAQGSGKGTRGQGPCLGLATVSRARTLGSAGSAEPHWGLPTAP